MHLLDQPLLVLEINDPYAPFSRAVTPPCCTTQTSRRLPTSTAGLPHFAFDVEAGMPSTSESATLLERSTLLDEGGAAGDGKAKAQGHAARALSLGRSLVRGVSRAPHAVTGLFTSSAAAGGSSSSSTSRGGGAVAAVLERSWKSAGRVARAAPTSVRLGLAAYALLLHLLVAFALFLHRC